MALLPPPPSLSRLCRIGGQEIEEKEKGGEIVKLGPIAYEYLISAFIAHVSRGMGGRKDENTGGGGGSYP